MKNLNESLNEIKNLKASVEEKKSLLIKVGLRPRDVEWLEFSGFFNEKTPLTFGVEIECNVYRSEIFTNAGSDFHFNYEGYNHTDRRDAYKFVTDGSVHGFSPIECVTPILDNNNSGFDSLKTCCKVLNDSHAMVNSTCGLHVHVGVASYSGDEIVNIYKNYQKLERLIDSFMAPSRRAYNAYYASSIQSFNYSKCHCPADVSAIMPGRYWKVNPMAYNRHQTVEFRQHQGTTDYQKISMWVNFCCKLVEWSKNNVLTTAVTDINEVPFLNAEEKAFYAGRIAHFAGMA